MAMGLMLTKLKGIATGFKAALSGGMDLLEKMGQWISDFVGDVIQWAKDVGSWIDEKIITPIGDFFEPLKPVVDAIATAFGAIFDGVIMVFNGELFQMIVTFIKGLKDGDFTIGDVFGAMVDFFGEKVQPVLDVWDNFKTGTVNLMGKFSGVVEDLPVIGNLITFWRAFKNPAVKVALKDKFAGALTKIPLIGALVTFWRAFKNPAVKVALKDKFMGALEDLPVIGPLITFWKTFQSLDDANKVKVIQKFMGKLEDVPVLGRLIGWWDDFVEYTGFDVGSLFTGSVPAPLQTIIDFFSNVFGLFDGEGDIGEEIGATLASLLDVLLIPITQVVDTISGIISAIVDFQLPVIGKSLRELVSSVDIPFLAEGGIVNTPTLAMIGEAGPEAVVPLNSQGRGMAGGNQTFNMTFNMSGITDRTDKRKLAQDVSQMIRTELRRDIGSTAVRGGLA